MLQSQRNAGKTMMRHTPDTCGDTLDRFVARYGEEALAHFMHKQEGTNGKLPPSAFAMKRNQAKGGECAA